MSTSGNAFADWNGFDFWRRWTLPGSFAQPILPGWTFNIDSNNSTAPQTEADVVQTQSYGRQLGRISDALHALILERHPTPPEDGAFGQFNQMWEQIRKVKEKSAEAQLRTIESQLLFLKANNEDAYASLRADLKAALKRTE